MDFPEPEPVDPNDLQPGPIKHASLPDKLLEQIRSIYEIIGPYLDTTLEQFEIGFMRDMHPENEVLVWSRITAAWIECHIKHLDGKRLTDEEESRLITALIVISTGITDLDKLGIPADVGAKILACYDALGREME